MALFIGLGSQASVLCCLQRISRLPNVILASVFPAVPTAWEGDPSLLQILDSRLNDAPGCEDLGRNGVVPPPHWVKFTVLTWPGFGFILIYPLNSNFISATVLILNCRSVEDGWVSPSLAVD